MKLAFIGLGVMGYPMAGHLAAAGYGVTVYNRTTARAAAWCAEHGGAQAATPAEAAAGADMVFVCVGNDDDVREVVLGKHGALPAMAAGGLLVDHTTASAALARELQAAAAARGIAFLDAPVSGGQAGAEKGALTIMVGGDEDAFAHAQPVFAAYARCARRLGPAGSGAPVHFHGHAVNVLAYGAKRWFLYPPAAARYSKRAAQPFARDLHAAAAAAAPEEAAAKKEREDDGASAWEPLECVQEAGDLMFVPTLWAHGTLNLKQSIGVAYELSVESFCME